MTMFFLFNWINYFGLYAQQIWLQGGGKRFQREGCKESLPILHWFALLYKDLVNELLLNHFEVKSTNVEYNFIYRRSD